MITGQVSENTDMRMLGMVGNFQAQNSGTSIGLECQNPLVVQWVLFALYVRALLRLRAYSVSSRGFSHFGALNSVKRRIHE